jgi:hypothetical protein
MPMKKPGSMGSPAWVGAWSRPRQLDEALELSDGGGVAHLAECLRPDLADALAGDLELAADVPASSQRVG